MAAIWSITMMEDYVEHDGHDRVIFTLHWQCQDSTAVDGLAYEAVVSGSERLEPFGDLDPFTEWADVTETQALGWLHDKMSAAEVINIEESVAAQLQRQIHPVQETGVPWT